MIAFIIDTANPAHELGLAAAFLLTVFWTLIVVIIQEKPVTKVATLQAGIVLALFGALAVSAGIALFDVGFVVKAFLQPHE